MPAPSLPSPTLTRRLDITAHKKAINAAYAAGTLAGGVGAMYAFSVSPDFGDPTNVAFFAGSDVPGGDYETLVVKPWLTGATNPASGPSGLGITNAAQVAATMALLRINASTIAQAAGSNLVGSLSSVATLGLTPAIMAAFAAALPTTDPDVPGAPWLDSGTLAFSQ